MVRAPNTHARCCLPTAAGRLYAAWGAPMSHNKQSTSTHIRNAHTHSPPQLILVSLTANQVLHAAHRSASVCLPLNTLSTKRQHSQPCLQAIKEHFLQMARHKRTSTKSATQWGCALRLATYTAQKNFSDHAARLPDCPDCHLPPAAQHTTQHCQQLHYPCIWQNTACNVFGRRSRLCRLQHVTRVKPIAPRCLGVTSVHVQFLAPCSARCLRNLLLVQIQKQWHVHWPMGLTQVCSFLSILHP